MGLEFFQQFQFIAEIRFDLAWKFMGNKLGMCTNQKACEYKQFRGATNPPDPK